MAIIVGTTTLNAGGVTYGASQIVIHASYNAVNILNDISLIRTANPISGSSAVDSIPIGSTNIGAGVAVSISGWGTTVAGGSLPNDLQFLNLVTTTNTECSSRHTPNPVFPSQICTYTQSGEGACNGDSGGPLVASGAVIGLVSWGRPCAIGYPDVFTRVSSFVPWIQSNAT